MPIIHWIKYQNSPLLSSQYSEKWIMYVMKLHIKICIYTTTKILAYIVELCIVHHNNYTVYDLLCFVVVKFHPGLFTLFRIPPLSPRESYMYDRSSPSEIALECWITGIMLWQQQTCTKENRTYLYTLCISLWRHIYFCEQMSFVWS